MTSNQIAYWSLQENQRANLAKERLEDSKQAETRRSNLAGEKLEGDKLRETNRANLMKEQIQRDTLKETKTHNRITEILSFQKNRQSTRDSALKLLSNVLF